METSMNRGMTDTGSSDNMQQELESLRSGFNKLRGDVAELFTHAFGFGRSGADYAREYGMDAMEQLKGRFNDMRAQGADQMANFEHRVEEKPMQSVMIAFGVGFILAKILHRH